jgi:methionyl-tRNA formyltransferase
VIERRLRAFDPQPGCHFELDGQTVKLWRAKVSAGFGADAGVIEVYGDRLRVACGDGGGSRIARTATRGGTTPIAPAFLAIVLTQVRRPSRR